MALFLSIVLFALSIQAIPVLANAQKLRVCVGDFPSYAIALDYLLRHKDRYEVSQTTVYACSIRFKKNYFDLIMADSFIYVTNDLHAADSRIVSLVNYSDGVDQVIGQKESSIADLRGSRWALQRGSVSTVLLSLFLKSQGLTLRDVILEDLKVENTPQAIGKTRFFGIVSWQPYARQALARGGQLLGTSADYQDKLYDFVVTRKSALAQHRPLIQAYLKERLDRARNRDKLYATYAELKKITVEHAADDFQGLGIFQAAADVKLEQPKALQSLRLSAEIADITQYSGRAVQNQLKRRENEIFDFSLLE